MDQTNYSKQLMADLSTDIGSKSAKYDEKINILDSKIKEMKEYWVEGDENAEALYTSLVDQFNKFKADLDEGHELMLEFKNQVDVQIGRYEDAEATVRSQIG